MDNRNLGIVLIVMLAACALVGGVLSYGVQELCSLVAQPTHCQELGQWVWNFFTSWWN